MILASSLSRHFGVGNAKVTALDELSLEIKQGEKVAILGRSGSGKSTLLNLIAGLDTPSSGTLTVNGNEPAKLDSNGKARYRLDDVGVVFQSFQLIAQRTAFQNIELPLILAGVPLLTRRKKVLALLQRVGLEKRAHHRPHQLSGGEQQRVSIARAMVNEPPVLLADEPTGNLDTKNASDVMALMLEMIDSRNSTLCLITHDDALADQVADRVIELRDGKLVSEKLASGKPVSP
ncbi:ABC transporter ATP-binding protein [Mariniblastus fucicola]|uniref:ABC transporter ATP-binding protein YtrE n=1 Tax=Mariniblastus fucicola TaxID=980251 RepID=A0A5B9PFR4_9BACT|nr:ABC transporter ATP-binding protein [Mariniblastus fucicola]QEG24035.1 ABC transporter ATP-binding protein YtrE [Mariniblastus fucicola]